MGKTALPQANPGAMKQSGRERGRGAGGGALRSIGSSFTGGAIRHANERRHARKSGPSLVIATGSLAVVAVHHVCHIAMRRSASRGHAASGANGNEGGGRAQRVRWEPYTQVESSLLRAKLFGDWESLEFMRDFWNPEYDERDILQYRRLAPVWRMRESGASFKAIANQLGEDTGKCCALVSGKNCRPYLAQMYLNREVLGKPRNGWKWILERTPKPTAPYPKVVEVPEKINGYSDVTDFLAQFPPVPKSQPTLEFFGVDVEWVERHKPELFGFLLAFLVGDAGKYYPEYENRGRHYNKAAMTTNMARTDSNFRVLKYVQLGLQSIGVRSHEIEAHQLPDRYEVVRWNSETSNLITWIIRTCLGLKPGERTTRVPIDMPWIDTCPRDFIVAFLQGLADSDGHVHKTRNYAEISSIPNSGFYWNLIEELDFHAKAYPLNNPKLVRMDLETACNIPLFNPIIRSYRYETLLQKLRNRGILPPPPSSFSISR